MLRLGLCGIFLFIAGLTSYLIGGLIVFANASLQTDILRDPAAISVRYSWLLILVGILLLLDSLLFRRSLKAGQPVLENTRRISEKMTVVLTAFNDELSIADSVMDFAGHKAVERVIVIDNNSTDNTARLASQAGAQVFTETKRGYGQCVYRGIEEALEHSKSDLILICEGDRTFRAFDIDKFVAYKPHVEIVNGTRIVEQLRASNTQVSQFIYYGNFFVGKLLEIKHIGRGTFTDVGTTYKLCSRSALQAIKPFLNPRINLEFNAHFLDVALTRGISVAECPITFHPRVGVSKGGNSSNWRAFVVGLKMIKGIIFGWPGKKDNA